MSDKGDVYLIVRARDARTGRFVPLAEAERRPNEVVVHTFLVKRRRAR